MWSEIGAVLAVFAAAGLSIFLVVTLVLMISKLLTEPVKIMCNCPTRLDGKTVLVTGGNSGIGFETAKDLAKRGARVIIADKNNAEGSVGDIIKSTGNSQVEYRHLDLADFKSVRAFADDVNKTFDRLDILVNNAGCLIEDKRLSKDGIDLMMQVNYLGPFLLTNLLLEKLIKAQSRIVIVSSGLYSYGEVDLQDLTGSKPENFFKAYINTKLCTVLWTKALAKNLPSNVSAFCLHPGMVSTNIVARFNGILGTFFKRMFLWLVKSPYEGAQTSIHACIAPGIETLSGSYFSNCRLTPTAKLVNDPKLVEDLWKETTLLLKDILNK
ncbi:unnamed protein product [Leptosia nina]|uniref:Uncharacterized protein n=1 Tax=Leptosia nina TaxID=320188 RepID=A0AAV1J581_9NEOP